MCPTRCFGDRECLVEASHRQVPEHPDLVVGRDHGVPRCHEGRVHLADIGERSVGVRDHVRVTKWRSEVKNLVIMSSLPSRIAPV